MAEVYASLLTCMAETPLQYPETTEKLFWTLNRSHFDHVWIEFQKADQFSCCLN